MSTATKEQSVVDAVKTQLFIGGEWRDGANGVLDVEDPATGETIAQVADASPDDAIGGAGGCRRRPGRRGARRRRAIAARSCAARGS